MNARKLAMAVVSIIVALLPSPAARAAKPPAPQAPAPAPASPAAKMVTISFKYNDLDFTIDAPEGAKLLDKGDIAIVKAPDFGLRIEFGSEDFFSNKAWWARGGIYETKAKVIDTDREFLVESSAQGPDRFFASAISSAPYHEFTIRSSKSGDMGINLMSKEACQAVLQSARTLKLKSTPPKEPLAILKWLNANVRTSEDQKSQSVELDYHSSDPVISVVKKLPNVTSLMLEGHLSNRVFDDLATMPALRELGVGLTPIDKPVLASVAKLKNLTHLALGPSLIAGTLDEEGMPSLAALTKLESLDITHTQATDKSLAAIKPLKQLKHFTAGSWRETNSYREKRADAKDSYRSKFTDAGFKDLAALTNLQTLKLRATTLTGAGLPVGSFPHLEELYLEDSLITDDGTKFIAGCPSLKIVKLGRTFIKGDGLKNLAGLKGLTELELSGTEVTDESLKSLAGLTSLETLELNNTGISDAGLKHLKGLKRLKTLKVALTNVTDAGLANLKGLSELEMLNLSGSKVTDAGLKSLVSMKKLLSVYADDTGVTKEGMKAYEKARDEE